MNTALAMYEDGEPNVPLFQIGDEVTAVEGPFQGYDGVVAELQQDLWLAVVCVPLFGREHYVLLRFHEIIKRSA